MLFVDLDVVDVEGDSALHCAVSNNAINAVESLMSHGAQPNIKNNRQMAPLHIAAKANKKHIMKVTTFYLQTSLQII